MEQTGLSRWTAVVWAGAVLGLASCSDNAMNGGQSPPGTNTGTVVLPGMGAGAGGGSMPRAEVPAAGTMASGTSGTMAAATGGTSGGMPSDMMTAGTGSPMGGTGGGAGTGANPIDPFTGPLDGDPGKPMVEVPGVPCGAVNVSFAGAPAANMVKITNRDVFVAYPCAHEGAAVTFYLAIHGTLQAGQKIPFTLTNFPVHGKVDSDNFIVVAPQAIGSQWGNGDMGQDLPHLYEVIDWVYATFGEKFSIRGMWASGGSWGSAYLYNFACDPMLEDRLTGIRMIVGRGCPACSTRLSCIVGEQELEEGMGMALSDAQKEQKIMATNLERYAQMHGCDARTGPTDVGVVRAWTWPNCDAGWAHSYYLGPGQHADRWDDPAYVDHMVAEMKATDR